MSLSLAQKKTYFPGQFLLSPNLQFNWDFFLCFLDAFGPDRLSARISVSASERHRSADSQQAKPNTETSNANANANVSASVIGKSAGESSESARTEEVEDDVVLFTGTGERQ